jgi:hypothetical protein
MLLGLAPLLDPRILGLEPHATISKDIRSISSARTKNIWSDCLIGLNVFGSRWKTLPNVIGSDIPAGPKAPSVRQPNQIQ